MPRLNRSGGLSDWGAIVELNQQRAALVKQNDALVEALYTALNTETAARIGSESGAMQGFDYKYHYDKIRAALEQVK